MQEKTCGLRCREWLETCRLAEREQEKFAFSTEEIHKMDKRLCDGSVDCTGPCAGEEEAELAEVPDEAPCLIGLWLDTTMVHQLESVPGTIGAASLAGMGT